MSGQAKVGIELIRPTNPLQPPPAGGDQAQQADIDGILLQLPEWQPDLDDTAVDVPAAPEPQVAGLASNAAAFDEATVESLPPAMGARPVAVRVGVAKPRTGDEPIRRSRLMRRDMPPEAPPAPAPEPVAEPASASPRCDAPSRRPTPEKPLAKNAQERVRNLSSTEQQKVARTGELPDRVALERLYGKAVWETLLLNPKLTPPEVLRIARMAALPMPLLEIIVANRAWLGSPQIRRALLTNRRLTKDMVSAILRLTPKSELKLMHKQTVYPAVVREAAAKLLR